MTIKNRGNDMPFFHKYISQLLQVSLFKDIEEMELMHILACFVPKVNNYSQGEYITLEGHEYTGVGIVLAGQVTITKSNEAAERIIMGQLGPSEIFGEMIAFSSINMWPASVIAKTKCQIMFITPEIIINHCSKMCVGHRQLLLNMLTIVSNKALGLNRKVNYLSIKSMRGKISKFLMEEYHKDNKKMFDIVYNRNELAEFLHVSRPSMSRELSRMKEEKIIDYHQSAFKILDLDQLSDYASHLD